LEDVSPLQREAELTLMKTAFIQNMQLSNTEIKEMASSITKKKVQQGDTIIW
jgi:hypothetical protein